MVGAFWLSEQMAQNGTGFQWSTRAQSAALLVAKDDQPDQAIADQLGIGRRTLARWKLHPDFQARVQEHRDGWALEIKDKGIADRQNRVDALNDRWRRMQTVINERAEDPGVAMVPGGSTGLIVHDVKGVGKGEDFRLIDLYAVDVGLLKELREHEKQAATEVGQWTEKRELTGQDGAPLVFTISIDRNEPDADRDD